MARVKQFANDLGISKNQAKNLINKGRSRKDGGSQILESVMKPKKYKAGGSETNPKAPVAKVKKTKLKKIVKEKDKFRADTTESLDKEFSKRVAKANKKKDGGFPDLSGDEKTTMKDVLIGRGVIEKAAGGPVKVRRAEPKRAESKRRPQASPSRRQKPKETLVPFKGVLKTSEGEKLRNVDGKTFVVKPPKSNTQKAKKMRGGGMAIQGTGFKGIR